MLESFIKDCSEWVYHHPDHGLALAFLISFIESLPIIGTIIPGMITMTMIGTLIGTQTLPLLPTVSATIMGALFGDYLGYYLGLFGQNKISKTNMYQRYKAFFVNAEMFFNQHGTLSIFIGRFIGPIRSTVPLVAGLLKMPQWLFTIAIIPTAVAWSLVYLTPGFIYGAYAVDIPHDKVVEYLIYFIIIFISFLLIHKNNRLRLSFEKKLMPSYPMALKHPLVSGLLALTSMFLITYLYEVIPSITYLDQAVLNFAYHLHTLNSVKASMYLAVFFDKYSLASAYAIVLIHLLYHQQYKKVLIIAFCSLGCSMSVFTLKHIFMNPRPDLIAHHLHSFSYPSGHAASVTTLAMILSHNQSKLFKSALVFIVCLTMTSRVFIGAHWLFDVFGGLCLGLTFGYLFQFLLRKNTVQWKINFNVLFYAIGFMLLISPIISKQIDYTDAQAYIKPAPSIEVINQDEWTNHKNLPFVRLNRFDHVISAMNLQYFGSQKILKRELETLGWKTTPKGSLLNLLSQKHRQTPLLDELYLNRPPVISMHKIMPNLILNLQFWQSVYQIDNTVILFGTIQKRNIPESWFLSEKEMLERSPLNLTYMLTDNLPFKKQSYTIGSHSMPIELKNINWDGRIVQIMGDH